MQRENRVDEGARRPETAVGENLFGE